ncbi:unnamed protein product [Effrenium voratum]|nr:unnamed protein product [Effrenium voratum]
MQPQALLTALPLFVIVRYNLFQDQLTKKATEVSPVIPQDVAAFPESKKMQLDEEIWTIEDCLVENSTSGCTKGCLPYNATDATSENRSHGRLTG